MEYNYLEINECTRVTPRRVPSLGKYDWAKINKKNRQTDLHKKM